jgi:plastocyanin
MALPAAASGDASAVDVMANGDIVTQLINPMSLSFTPGSVDALVGQTVRWTNTDFFVPHTVTEDHGLFDLAGTYGATPFNPAGFAPGASVSLVAAAGTFHYYCRVHPVQMHGVMAVPVTLSVQRPAAAFAFAAALKHKATPKHHRKHKAKAKPKPKPKPKTTPPAPQARISATWATQPPPPQEVFDVRYRSGSGAWQTLEDGTTAPGASFAGGPTGTVWQVQARLRSKTNSAAASDWSPVASISS